MKKDNERAQVTVNVDRALRQQLQAAAKREVRSVSAEIVKRLRDSFAEQSDAAA